MTLYAHQSLFGSLYDAAPKLLLLKSPAELRQETEADALLRSFALKLDDGQRLVLVQANGERPENDADLLPLSVPPTNVWAIWVSGSDYRRAGELLMRWWTLTGGEASPPRLVEGDKTALKEVLLSRSLEESQRLARVNEMLLRDIAAIREAMESHVRIPQEVQELVENLRLAPAKLIFSGPARSGAISIPFLQPGQLATMGGELGGANALCQRLPVTARGFGGLDLTVVDPGSGIGRLHIALVARDSDERLADWRIRLEDLREGTMPLRLEKYSSLPWRPLELRILAEGSGKAPRLGTSAAGLLPEFGVEQPEGDAPSEEARMLSMRIWGGFPGLPTDAALRGMTALPPPNPVVTIDPADIAEVRLTREINESYPCFGYLESGRVLLRPFPKRISAALVPLPDYDGLSAIKCSIAVDESRCRTRGLAARIVVMPPGLGPDEAERAAASGEGALAASDWVELDHPMDARPIRADLAAPGRGPVDLHLFTRLPDGGSIQHVRMIFAKFEAEIDARALQAMGPFLPEAQMDDWSRQAAE